MQADSHTYHPSRITPDAHAIIRDLSIAIDCAVEELGSIRGIASVVELAFHPPGRGMQPADKAIGTACLALLVSICDNSNDKRIPAVGGSKFALTIYQTPEGKVVFKPHVAGLKTEREWTWDKDAFAPAFAQELLQVLMAE